MSIDQGQRSDAESGRATVLAATPLKLSQLAAEPVSASGKVRQQPVQITALSGEVIDHRWWGRIAFDHSGMFRRGDQSPIDWGHDYETTLGNFTATQIVGSELQLTGVLLARVDDPDHKSHEVIDLMAAGQHYQASIDFTNRMDGDWEAIYLQEGVSAFANGREYIGPLTLFTHWPLNAVAIFSHGYDPYTSAGPVPAQLSAKLPQGHPMTKPATLTPDVPAIVEKKTEAAPLPDSEAAKLASDPATPPAIDTAPTQLTPETLSAWTKQFGAENAVTWLTGGKSLAEAHALHGEHVLSQLAAKDQQIADLQARLTALRPGIDQPTGASMDLASGGGKSGGSQLTATDRTAQAIEERLSRGK